MDLAQQAPPSTSDHYWTTFGSAGAFDKTLYPEHVTIALMAQALSRGSAVTLADLDAMHVTVYQAAMPPSQEPLYPSGATMATGTTTETSLPASFAGLAPRPSVMTEAPPGEAPMVAREEMAP